MGGVLAYLMILRCDFTVSVSILYGMGGERGALGRVGAFRGERGGGTAGVRGSGTPPLISSLTNFYPERLMSILYYI